MGTQHVEADDYVTPFFPLCMLMGKKIVQNFKEQQFALSTMKDAEQLVASYFNVRNLERIEICNLISVMSLFGFVRYLNLTLP